MTPKTTYLLLMPTCRKKGTEISKQRAPAARTGRHSVAGLLLLLVAALSQAASATTTLEGRVIGVSDGDTLTVLTPEKTQVKVRLAQIDAPEKSQAFGTRSKQSLSELVFGKEVHMVVKDIAKDKDRYGRTVGRIYTGNLDINAEQVSRGMAWVYVYYANDPKLFALEREAKAAKRGLWVDPHPVPPWEFRRGGHRQAISPKLQSEQGKAFTCGSKRRCKEMSSCEEARFYLTRCGLTSLDGNSDGVPCESLC